MSYVYKELVSDAVTSNMDTVTLSQALKVYMKHLKH